MGLIMKHINHEKHLHEAHNAHALGASRRIELLSKVKSGSVSMTDISLQSISILFEIRAEIFKEVSLSCLEVVRLDCMNCLRIDSEGYEVVNC